MKTTAKVIGVHPVEAEEPVHLIELLVEGDVDGFDIADVTQEVIGSPRENWQVPYDDRLIEEIDGKARYAFFFHYLDLQKPFTTNVGSLPLPNATETPVHLEEISYESP